MMHKNRVHCVGPVASAEELAHMLTERTWTLCCGFYVLGHECYLFLNDSTHEDGAGEWAAILGGVESERHVQIESITFSWCEFDQALKHVQDALAGRMDRNDFARPVTLRLETPEQHQRCPLCA
jgi:hypothetical protein